MISSRTKQQQCQWMVFVGVILTVLGFAWSFTFPFNKALWTSSYVLWTSGLAYLTFALCYVLIEIKQWTLWARPLCLFGKNALLVYVLHVVFLKIQAIIWIYNSHGNVINFRMYITEVLFGHLTLKNASLCYAVAYTLLWLLVLKYKNLPIYKKFGYSPPI